MSKPYKSSQIPFSEFDDMFFKTLSTLLENRQPIPQEMRDELAQYLNGKYDDIRSGGFAYFDDNQYDSADLLIKFALARYIGGVNTFAVDEYIKTNVIAASTGTQDLVEKLHYIKTQYPNLYKAVTSAKYTDRTFDESQTARITEVVHHSTYYSASINASTTENTVVKATIKDKVEKYQPKEDAKSEPKK